MRRSMFFGIFSSILGLIGLIRLFTASSDLPVYQWPIEAFQGLVFTLGWAVGVPESLACPVAALSVLVVLAVLFVAGKKVSGLLD
ncbi:MAG: hypothetical protein GYB26_00930 [Gammaproteobacteria bacterium]|uniref:Uncharacterized protein n=1 Tax=Marinobacter litoralis TaxID=187981 RepID=A0A3M2R9X8_9GAMM|nr:hypothetical protein [Marinobacter litoralis]MBR9869685.1 hypothetical protein [Gammaproteobacteria bacterium]RMJ02092.1 hypothetical protein DOQ08_02885 [Marinobacter litoralis]